MWRGRAWIFVISAILALFWSGCKSEAPSPAASPVEDAGVAAPPTVEVGHRPPVVGDVDHGWRVYQEHCGNCHGPGRRGNGESRSTLRASPQDLRDPLFLVKRTDDDLARAILQGGLFVRRSKDMPGFAAELSEQDVQDLIALMRGDAISLEECFPRASHYRRVFVEQGGPPVLAAYETAPTRTERPVVLRADEPLPLGARKVGYVLFAELELPGAGPTPTAFVANLQGSITGMRVALPEKYAQRAREDLEDVVLRRIPKLPTLMPVLEGGAQRLSSLVRTSPAATATP